MKKKFTVQDVKDYLESDSYDVNLYGTDWNEDGTNYFYYNVCVDENGELTYYGSTASAVLCRTIDTINGETITDDNIATLTGYSFKLDDSVAEYRAMIDEIVADLNS